MIIYSISPLPSSDLFKCRGGDFTYDFYLCEGLIMEPGTEQVLNRCMLNWIKVRWSEVNWPLRVEEHQCPAPKESYVFLLWLLHWGEIRGSAAGVGCSWWEKQRRRFCFGQWTRLSPLGRVWLWMKEGWVRFIWGLWGAELDEKGREGIWKLRYSCY